MTRVMIIDGGAWRRLSACWGSIGTPNFVGAATNVNEGMLLMAEHTSDLIFLDVKIPGQNGVQVARCSSSLHPIACLVIVSLNDCPAYLAKAMEVGAGTFVRKTHLATALALPLDNKPAMQAGWACLDQRKASGV